MKLFFTTFFILILTISYGQDTITTKVIVFDEEDMSKYNSDDREYGKNAIKINPLLYFNGEIPIYYERAISKSFSVEAAIGITYKDYIGSLFDDNDNDFGDSDNDQIHPQPSFKLGLRYYTGGYALEDFYFALEFAHRKYAVTKEVEYFENNSIVTTELKEENSINEFKLIIGSQAHSYWDNFFVDYYAGVGIKNEEIIEISIDDIATGNNNNIIIPILDKRTKSSPALYLGLKIGFEF